MNCVYCISDAHCRAVGRISIRLNRRFPESDVPFSTFIHTRSFELTGYPPTTTTHTLHHASLQPFQAIFIYFWPDKMLKLIIAIARSPLLWLPKVLLSFYYLKTGYPITASPETKMDLPKKSANGSLPPKNSLKTSSGLRNVKPSPPKWLKLPPVKR